MRLRKIAGADQRVADHARVLRGEARGQNWLTHLAQDRPVYLEIGMGKGDFILAMAPKYPQWVFLGLEKYSSVLLKALEKYDCLEEKRENLWFLWEDAQSLSEVFPAQSIAGLYLNFSDPWPKARYAKRRLTSPAFLDLYYRLLKPGARLEFKTDNQALFQFSLDSINEHPNFDLSQVYWDLHSQVDPAENVMTEYERKFSDLGHPIYKLIAVRK